ncbi:Gfo/Idh/MocA family oxidoreductase [Paenibacillus macerans]|uniref:Oxidoreductase, NAD-binding Rossmann fold family protein n=1 Tax=Paenibacillus macerans TaxID=44252 RepID=A0A090Y7R2_PAEMA|nr:Gfo/Idh/MocA family oxidoreductase [Paenibacillus macerans]KFM94484.1 oxidoreductase, NAD-binding Rossmann fold family protein [Paenibacillus macerans]MBS5910099.1 Gfo/Idh/MocA family oxidoreductase [Paenibacillus macerans]MCY7557207.1 Gfo/Idh/MocA family oxidoreductase [Paenibacillus macerans]MDU5947669.1 Gfo/Idh/MocA family oxidoreductase [Paenibacillus macerans]MEC0138758.1 Gfo/Idh/MocA family oxidoreductase [Paenibacillus macerans]
MKTLGSAGSAKIRTGIIGGSLNNQWASRTHIPALTQSTCHEITAIATSNMASAKESAAALGVTQTFDDYRELVRSENVDLVVVSVKVPHHYEMIKEAIAAGKHVYSEWPLAVTSEEAEELAELASQKGIHHAVGLQARQSPALLDAKNRISRGDIGRVLSASMAVSTPGKGGFTEQNAIYLLEEKYGATLLSINGGHSLDALSFVLGDLKEVYATMNSNYSEAKVLGTGETVPKDTADQIMVHGMLESGASVSVHIQGGTYPKFELEIQGEKGVIRISQPQSQGHVQFGGLVVEQALYPLGHLGSYGDHETLQRVYDETEDGSVTVNQVLKAHRLLAEDIRQGTFQAPGFHEAARLHRLLETIRQSALTGERLSTI